MAYYNNPPEGFRDIDHARNSVNEFLKGLIQVNKGNKITATGRTNSAIFRAIVENEVRGVFGYYLRCSNCKNQGKGCLRLKCTARAVGSYEFDDESIQRINEFFRSNEKCRNINSPIVDHVISSSLFTTDLSSSSIATFNFPDEEKEEEAVTIVEDFISYYDRGRLENSSSSSSPGLQVMLSPPSFFPLHFFLIFRYDEWFEFECSRAQFFSTIVTHSHFGQSCLCGYS